MQQAPICDKQRAQEIASNLRRLMARRGFNITHLAEASGMDYRTVSGVVNAKRKTQTPTLTKLAATLECDVGDLLASDDPRFAFDRATNPEVMRVVEENPKLFSKWTRGEFDELCSHRGVGGELTEDGILRIVQEINARREVVQQVCVIMGSPQAELLRALVATLYGSVVIRS